VTLKMRTGWADGKRNAVSIRPCRRKSAGVAMLTVHGRTREQAYRGDAEYHTIAQVKAAVRIPVVANGDIDSAHKARDVLAMTGADAVMIGRAAQGRPWIFREIGALSGHRRPVAATAAERGQQLMLTHLQDHYDLYGEYAGVRSARKHVGWYVKNLPDAKAFRDRLNTLDDCAPSSSKPWQIILTH
jgi:tRNA-dihydrouridine synthase B